jgi:PTS system N-acetylglucosamine-specific IIC component
MTQVTTTADGLPPAPAIQNPVLAVLQRLGRSLMLPIAVLPAAGILLRLGQNDLLGVTPCPSAGTSCGLAGVVGPWMGDVGNVVGAAGGAVFGNLPLLFALGIAVGFARRSDGSTAVAALAGYFVFNGVYTAIAPVATGAVATATPGVLGGILVGITAALLWQRFYRIKLPPWLAFFGGRRFVPIITAVACLVEGVILGVIWPPFGDHVITPFGHWMAQNGVIGAGVYGAFNRALIPLGLHHIINSIMWFTPAGATCGKLSGDLTCYFAGQQGAGTYMAGFFPIMMFGLPGAALAMYQCARPERKALVGGLMLSAAITSFVCGITEPIEFAFIFTAPLLFLVDIVLTGSSLMIAAALNVKIGFSFSAGLIDYSINFTKANTHNAWLVIVLGVIYGVVYYFVFRFLIQRFNLYVFGREPAEAEVTAEAGAAGAP